MRSLLLCIAIALAPGLVLAKAKPKHPKAAPLASAPAAGELVPASAAAALLFEGPQSAEGLRALLGAAGSVAPSLAPALVSQDLVRAVGVDPLGSGAEGGLAPAGARALVLDARAMGFSAPVADEARAKKLLQAWLSQLGPARPTRAAPLKGPLASGSGDQVRAGMVAPVAGGLRLLTASGRGAAALVSQLAHVGHKAQDTMPMLGAPSIAAALAAVPGTLRFWSRGEGPILGTLVALDASAAGLNAHGLVLAMPGSPALLEGAAPPESACAGAPLLCARGAPGPALRAFAPLIARQLIARDLLGGPRDALDALLQGALESARGGVLLRLDSLDGRALGQPEQLLSAMSVTLASGAGDAPRAAPETLPPDWKPLVAPQSGLLLSSRTQLCLQSQPGALWLAAPCGPLPAHFSEEGGARELTARLDAQLLAQSLSPLTALSSFRGGVAAGAFAAKLLWGDLLSHSGPIALSAKESAPGAAAGSPLAGALDLSFAWPLSTGASAK